MMLVAKAADRTLWLCQVQYPLSVLRLDLVSAPEQVASLYGRWVAFAGTRSVVRSIKRWTTTGYSLEVFRPHQSRRRLLTMIALTQRTSGPEEGKKQESDRSVTLKSSLNLYLYHHNRQLRTVCIRHRRRPNLPDWNIKSASVSSCHTFTYCV